MSLEKRTLTEIIVEKRTITEIFFKGRNVPEKSYMLLKDLKMYLRTNKYVKQNQSTSNRSEVKRILQDKAQLNAERKRNPRGYTRYAAH